MDSPCIKQTVCKVLKIFQYGKYLVAYVLKSDKMLDHDEGQSVELHGIQNMCLHCRTIHKTTSVYTIHSGKEPCSTRYLGRHFKSKKEGKDQESIQSSTTPDPGYQRESDNVTIRHHRRESRGHSFPAGYHKASTNRRA